MKQVLAFLAAGALFGAGLAVSGMTDPGKVIGFLDFVGVWDPSLALVLVGAMATTAVGVRLVERRPAPLFGGSFPAPSRGAPDMRLVGGSLCFGVGWGMAGFCPGPAVTNLARLDGSVGIFVLAMLAGMVAAQRFAAADR